MPKQELKQSIGPVQLLRRVRYEVARKVQPVQVQPRLFRKNISETFGGRKSFQDADFRSAFDVGRPGRESNR